MNLIKIFNQLIHNKNLYAFLVYLKYIKQRFNYFYKYHFLIHLKFIFF